MAAPFRPGGCFLSKIAVGSASVQQAFGMSTMPLMPALDRGAAEEQVGLLAGEPELLQVLDGVQAGPAVRDVHVQVVLLARELVDGDALEDQVLGVVRLDRARA